MNAVGAPACGQPLSQKRSSIAYSTREVSRSSLPQSAREERRRDPYRLRYRLLPPDVMQYRPPADPCRPPRFHKGTTQLLERIDSSRWLASQNRNCCGAYSVVRSEVSAPPEIARSRQAGVFSITCLQSWMVRTEILRSGRGG